MTSARLATRAGPAGGNGLRPCVERACLDAGLYGQPPPARRACPAVRAVAFVRARRGGRSDARNLSPKPAAVSPQFRRPKGLCRPRFRWRRPDFLGFPSPGGSLSRPAMSGRWRRFAFLLSFFRRLVLAQSRPVPPRASWRPRRRLPEPCASAHPSARSVWGRNPGPCHGRHRANRTRSGVCNPIVGFRAHGAPFPIVFARAPASKIVEPRSLGPLRSPTCPRP